MTAPHNVSLVPVSPGNVWAKCPFGIAIYVPKFDDDGAFYDLVLLWVNDQIITMLGYNLREWIGKNLSEVSNTGWLELKSRFGVMIATGVGFSYARQQSTFDGGFDYMATAWYAEPYITILVTQESRLPMANTITDPGDIDAAMRLIDARAERTIELASLLASLEPARDVDPAGLEPATSRVSDGRSST